MSNPKSPQPTVPVQAVGLEPNSTAHYDQVQPPTQGDPGPAPQLYSGIPFEVERDGSKPGYHPPLRPGDDIPPELASLTKYELLGELGRGGMGAVYKVREKSLGRIVALKMMIGAINNKMLERFIIEARSAAKLNHPGIVPIFEIDSVGQFPYFTMAFIEGGSLSSILKAKGPMAPMRAAQILRQVAQAVAYAHENSIIHRDLKPDNIMIDPQGNARLTDFGLAKDQTGEQNLTNTGAVLGTPSYMAPEQARGASKFVGKSADIYALGGILYACLVGKPPFTGETAFDIIIKVAQDEPPAPSSLVATVPSELEAICLQCLRKEPEQRYPSAAAVADALDGWLVRVGAGTNPNISGPSLPSVIPPGAQRAVGSTVKDAVPVLTTTVSAFPTSQPTTRSVPARTARLVLALVVSGVVVTAVFMNGFFLTPQARQAPAERSTAVETVSPATPAAVAAWLPGLDPRNDFGLRVAVLDGTVKGNQLVLLEKRPFGIRVSVEKDAHVAVWTRDQTGAAIQLFPNDKDLDSLVMAGRPRDIPGTGKEYVLEPEYSGHKETLTVVATDKPISTEPKETKVGPFRLLSPPAMDSLLRSIKVKPVAKPTLSSFDIIYRVDKEP